MNNKNAITVALAVVILIAIVGIAAAQGMIGSKAQAKGSMDGGMKRRMWETQIWFC